MKTKGIRTAARLLLLGASGAPIAMATPAMAQQQLYRFDIPAQSLDLALRQVARTAQAQILFDGQSVAGRTSGALIGSYTVEEALARLMSGSELTVQRGNSGVFTVRPARKIAASSRSIGAFAEPSRPVLASGQDNGAPIGSTAVQEPVTQPASEEIVVTGIRQSLERAAEIKQNAVQVVDSIVAQDIGKFPDPTTAAALQRVPGVQVSVDRQNELSGVRIRGLTDILTTVDGREVFTTNDRSFDLQDLPAEALARVDVVKSQTADLVEGGVAGVINLKLNKPFSFTKPTVVLSARGNYGVRVDKVSPQIGVLATDRWNTGIGEIGLLVNGTWSRNHTLRTQTNLTDRRSSAASPIGTPGYFLPNILQNIGNAGTFERSQVNAALQWQVSPAVEAYVDAFYTGFKNQVSSSEFNVQTFTTNVQATDITPTDNCFLVRATNAGQNPTIINGVDPVTGEPTQTLQPNSVQTLCDVSRVTFTNAVANQTAGSRDIDQHNKMIAGGVRYDRDGVKANVDLAYQTSFLRSEEMRTAVGQRLPSLTLETDVDGGARLTVPGDYLTRTDTLSLRNQLIQNFQRSTGSLFQAKADAEYELGDWLDKLQVGVRYADRSAVFRQAQLNTPIPYGNIGTPSEANARLVSSFPTLDDFLELSNMAPRLNDGGHFYAPGTEFMRSDDGRDALRAVYNLEPGDPAYEPTRQFDAKEKTYAVYGQASYDVPIGAMTLDGVIGLRATRTNRTISTFDADLNRISASTSDLDLLPNASARLKLGGGFQTRLTYAKTLRRPDFGALNPARTLVLSGNPAVQSSGNAGNPNLRPQKSDAFDATIEYYARSGSIAVTGYHRKIVDRVINTAQAEDVDGVSYIISRPRNVGQAELKGVEISGQYFFDFLPGAFSGLGAMGAFTYADSKVKGDDPLAGLPLQGVSKYNYTAGLLYDKYGVSGRVVYTYRSSYAFADITGEVQLRPIDPDRAGEVFVPPLLEYARPAGRLDFSLGYDITPRIRFDIGGTNVLRSRTKTYRGETFFNGNVFDDETTYTAGVRVRF